MRSLYDHFECPAGSVKSANELLTSTAVQKALMTELCISMCQAGT